jgi:hypothetical protein
MEYSISRLKHSTTMPPLKSCAIGNLSWTQSFRVSEQYTPRPKKENYILHRKRLGFSRRPSRLEIERHDYHKMNVLAMHFMNLQEGERFIFRDQYYSIESIRWITQFNKLVRTSRDSSTCAQNAP